MEIFHTEETLSGIDKIMKDPQVGAVGTKKASSGSEVCTEGIISSLQTSGSLIIFLVPLRVSSVFFYSLWVFPLQMWYLYIIFKKTRAKINAKQVDRIKCYSGIFFFAIWEMQLSIIQAIKRGKGLTSPWCASS